MYRYPSPFADTVHDPYCTGLWGHFVGFKFLGIVENQYRRVHGMPCIYLAAHVIYLDG